MADEFEMNAEMKDADDVFLVMDKPGAGYGFPISHNEDGELGDDFPMVYAVSFKYCTIKELEAAKKAGLEGPEVMDLHEAVYILGFDELEALARTTNHILEENNHD